MKLSGAVLIIVVGLWWMSDLAVRSGHPAFRIPLVSAALAAAMLGIARAYWKRGGGSDFHRR